MRAKSFRYSNGDTGRNLELKADGALSGACSIPRSARQPQWSIRSAGVAASNLLPDERSWSTTKVAIWLVTNDLSVLRTANYDVWVSLRLARKPSERCLQPVGCNTMIPCVTASPVSIRLPFLFGILAEIKETIDAFQALWMVFVGILCVGFQ